jgi:hypothetical protein
MSHISTYSLTTPHPVQRSRTTMSYTVHAHRTLPTGYSPLLAIGYGPTPAEAVRDAVRQVRIARRAGF